MKDFLGWIEANESVLGRTAGQVAGHVANIPGRVANWAGKEIKDFRGGYAQARKPIGPQQPIATPATAKPSRPIGPAVPMEPGDEEGLWPGEPVDKQPYKPLVPIGPAEDISDDDFLSPGEPVNNPVAKTGPFQRLRKAWHNDPARR